MTVQELIEIGFNKHDAIELNFNTELVALAIQVDALEIELTLKGIII